MTRTGHQTRLTPEAILPLVRDGHSTNSIAAILGSTQSGVHRAMKRLGIKCVGKPGTKPKIPVEAAPIGRDERDEWEPIGGWDLRGNCFEDAPVRPVPMRRPVMPETGSGCSSAALMAMEG